MASKDTVRVPSADAGPSASIPGGAGTRTGPAPGPPPAAGGGGLRKRGLALAQRFPSLARRFPSLVRHHWLLALLLAVGLVLRVATQIAYRPALFYIDSMKYLFGAYPGNDPPGYQILIRPLLAVDPSFLAGLQHVLGLAMAVVLYVVLQRR